MSDNFMLWYNASKEPLEKKIKKAVAYYQTKYGRAPERVDVCPQEMKKDFVRPEGLVIKANILVVSGHMFVGMIDK